MRHLWTLLMLVAASINLAPALGAAAPDRMDAAPGPELAHVFAREVAIEEHVAEVHAVRRRVPVVPPGVDPHFWAHCGA